MNVQKGNPFTPTFGCVPIELAGREEVLTEILEGLDNAPGDPNRASIFIGARGTGKTVLLASIAERAEAEGWISANVTAREGMLDEILVQIKRKASHILELETESRITELKVKGSGFSREIKKRQTTWRSELTELVEALNESHTGLLMTVDEASVSVEELRILVDVFQHLVRERRDVALMVAGLPHNISLLLDDDALSFMRRGFKHSMDAISQNDVAYAMRETVEGSGRKIEPEALEMAARAAQGYAFLIQLIGYHMWRQDLASDVITKEAVERAIEYAERDMEASVLGPTLRDLSDREKEFLEAMLKDEDESSLADIAARMGIDSNNASQIRKRIIERGVIAPRGRGKVGFEMPMLRSYLADTNC